MNNRSSVFDTVARIRAGKPRNRGTIPGNRGTIPGIGKGIFLL
jgi:hypothetical protein